MMKIDYGLAFIEGFRGESDISGSVYMKHPEIGWVWTLNQYHLVRDVEDDNLNIVHTVVLASSNSVFPDMTEAVKQLS